MRMNKERNLEMKLKLNDIWILSNLNEFTPN